MPRLYYRANQMNQGNGAGAGALPNRFCVGYRGNHGFYLELDFQKNDETLRQEICSFVNRTQQLQLDIWDLGFSYMAYDGSLRAFYPNTVADACTYVQNYFSGRDTAYLYIWNRLKSSLDNFKFKDEVIKPEILYKNEV